MEEDGGIAAQIVEEEVVELACDLLRIPSFKAGGESELARWLHGFFVERSYQVELQEVAPGRFQTIAVLPGEGGGGRSLMLNGHIDIDPLAAGWRRDPWKPSVEGGRLYGAGARNMKGGLASLISAAEAVRRAKRPRRGDLVVACVLGELSGGEGTVAMLERGMRTDAAIVPEPVGENLVTTHAGVLEFSLSTTGRSEHISRKPEAKDAMQAMMKLIAALGNVDWQCKRRDDLPALPILNVGGIIGGRGRDYDLRGPNFTCDYCTALLDVRFLPGQTAESVLRDVERCLKQVGDLDGVTWEISRESREPYSLNTVVFEPTEIPTDAEIVQLVHEEFVRIIGHAPGKIGVSLPASYSGDDTAHLWRAGIPCLMYGPGGGSHQGYGEVDDHVDVGEMVRCAKVLATVADRYCR
ncbi:MAG: M20 family metallopeptidase [Clostridia bacterium]